MKLLITSGGTREPIDAARFITNTSTGRTGRVLADGLAARGCAVHCLRAAGSERPAGRNISISEFSSFKDLDAALKRALRTETFDAVIHLAAVSDYSPALIEAGGKEFLPGSDAKLDSSAPEIRLTLRRNFKILDRIKSYAAAGARPEPLLIAFKLTSGASPEKIRQKVRALSAADLVVHNDLAEMKNSHLFHLYHLGRRTVDCKDPDGLAAELYRFLNDQLHKRQKAPAGRKPGRHHAISTGRR